MTRFTTPSGTEGTDGTTGPGGIPTSWAAWGLLLVASVGSRLATTITYIEDPDSLRFALSIADEYDVASLQPHFPGYPVFWAVAKIPYLLTGSFSTAFSLVGGLAIAAIVWALLRLRGTTLLDPEGLALAAVTLGNPLLWVMSNRYMPDLLGVACALVALVFLFRALAPWERAEEETVIGLRVGVIGMVGAGLLAGLRLSTLPLLLPPVVALLWRGSHPVRYVAAGAGAVLVWLVPLVIETGLIPLYDVAWAQTTGHFTEFGGTIQTESNLARRLTGFVRGLWADGLGGWWPGRHPITAVVGVCVLGLGTLGVHRLVQRDRSPWYWWGLVACAAVYAVWIFFFQNVVHKSRHVLPLVPLLLMPVAAGGVALWRKERWGRVAVGLATAAYLTVTAVLVSQHTDPTAIAQAKRFLSERTEQGPIQVASVPLVNNYLQAQRVDARYFSVEDSAAVGGLRRTGASARTTYVVGTYSSILERRPDTVHTFYHNPFVNRMWPEVTVFVYDP